MPTGAQPELQLPQPGFHKRIGILVVAFNAVNTLARVLRRIPPHVWEAVDEVAVFDDASKDDTFELGVGFKATTGIEKLTVLRNSRNLGYGGNQKQGYMYFMNKGFDFVILLHGDGQYAPESLESMYLPLLRGEADAVLGSRMMREYGGALKGGMPVYKFVGNRILTLFENAALGMRLSEFHSGYRAYSLGALGRIDLSRMTDDFHFDTQIIIKLHHQGFRIREVPIPTYYGGEISYVNGMRYARDVFLSVIRFRRTVLGSARSPEFSEYFVQYPLKQSKYSSHYYFERLAGRNNDVLDIGCGQGFFAERIANLGNRVVGTDRFPRPSQVHALADYIQADLDRGMEPIVARLGGLRFDRILLQDVLEHLHHPELFLSHCAKFLKTNGQVLVSVPNIANITVRLSLLFGRFEYSERGILDRTHLHFYTRSNARRLLQDAGYVVLESFATIMPIELGVGVSANNPVMRILAQILRVLTSVFPGLLGYQWVFVIVPKRDATQQG